MKKLNTNVTDTTFTTNTEALSFEELETRLELQTAASDDPTIFHCAN